MSSVLYIYFVKVKWMLQTLNNLRMMGFCLFQIWYSGKCYEYAMRSAGLRIAHSAESAAGDTSWDEGEGLAVIWETESSPVKSCDTREREGGTGEPATEPERKVWFLVKTAPTNPEQRDKRKPAGEWNSSISCLVAEEMSSPDNESVRHPWTFIASEEMQRQVAQPTVYALCPKVKGHASPPLTDRWPINYCKRTDSCSLRDEGRSYVVINALATSSNSYVPTTWGNMLILPTKLFFLPFYRKHTRALASW